MTAYASKFSPKPECEAARAQKRRSSSERPWFLDRTSSISRMGVAKLTCRRSPSCDSMSVAKEFASPFTSG